MIHWETYNPAFTVNNAVEHKQMPSSITELLPIIESIDKKYDYNTISYEQFGDWVRLQKLISIKKSPFFNMLPSASKKKLERHIANFKQSHSYDQI